MRRPSRRVLVCLKPRSIYGPRIARDEVSMTARDRFLFDTIQTPLGTEILCSGEDGALRFHSWDDEEEAWRLALQRRHGDVDLVPGNDSFGHSSALRRYYAGEITALDGLPVVFRGTPFQQRVWTALRAIPAGTTLSYAALAQRIGAPNAVRAVGLANGSNPVGVIVPCHRVIGSDGSLTGYGGGLARKRWLLAHEQRHSSFRLELSE